MDYSLCGVHRPHGRHLWRSRRVSHHLRVLTSLVTWTAPKSPLLSSPGLRSVDRRPSLSSGCRLRLQTSFGGQVEGLRCLLGVAFIFGRPSVVRPKAFAVLRVLPSGSSSSDVLRWSGRRWHPQQGHDSIIKCTATLRTRWALAA